MIYFNDTPSKQKNKYVLRPALIVGLIILLVLVTVSCGGIKETVKPVQDSTIIASGLTTAQTESVSQPTDKVVEVSSSDVIDENINEIARKYSTSGLSLAAFRGQSIVYSYNFGYADMKKTKPVSGETRFRIASISKTVTGLLAMRLVSKGDLLLDRDISDYIGISVRSPSFPEIPVTTRMLMAHSSGIIDGAAYTQNTDLPPFQTLEAVLNQGNCFSKSRPGTRFSYSNFGAGLIAGVVEGASGQRFFHYAEQQLNSLGIDASYVRTGVKSTDSIAQIFRGNTLRADVPDWERIPEGYANIPLGQMYLLGHGDLIISAPDLAKIAIVLAGDGTYGDDKFLPADLVSAMNTPAVSADYGLTVIIDKGLIPGRTIYGHSGQAYGMVAGLYYDPSDQTGIVFITNGCSTEKNSTGKYAITYDLMNMLYGMLFN